MVPAVPAAARPPYWPTDGRDGGVPDPRAAGPEMIQIGNECGLLPAPVVLANRPVGYRYDRRDPSVLNVDGYTLMLAPGERADVVVDFSRLPAGANLILYNDCPAPLPGADPRHTTPGRRTERRGGPPPSRAVRPEHPYPCCSSVLDSAPAEPYDVARLAERLPGAYAASQRPPIVPQPAYDRAFGTRTARETLVPVHATSVSFTPTGGTAPITLPLAGKAVQDVFEPGTAG
jgi:hypothetical protein